MSSRLSSLHSDTQCQLSNAESAKILIEREMKEQEGDLKTEIYSKTSEIASLTKELEGARGKQKLVQEQANQYIDKVSSLEMEKRLVVLGNYLI